MIKVLIADDHKVLIDGIKSMLLQEETIQIVGEAANGEEVLKQMKSLEVDVILLDINMPKKDGIDTCKSVKQQHPKVKVIALTMYNEGSFIQAMLKNGASGYLLKNSGKDEIIKAIQTVYQDDTYFSEDVSKILMTSMIPGTKKVKSTDFLPKLTRREKEILLLIIEELTTQEIANKLFVSLSTVETHRKNLLSKMGVRNTAGLVKVAFQRGMVDTN